MTYTHARNARTNAHIIAEYWHQFEQCYQIEIDKHTVFEANVRVYNFSISNVLHLFLLGGFFPKELVRMATWIHGFSECVLLFFPSVNYFLEFHANSSLELTLVNKNKPCFFLVVRPKSSRIAPTVFEQIIPGIHENPSINFHKIIVLL